MKAKPIFIEPYWGCVKVTASNEERRDLVARRGNAEVMHRLAAEELADRRAQHRASVGGTRVGRLACALQLELLAAAVAGLAAVLLSIDGQPNSVTHSGLLMWASRKIA